MHWNINTAWVVISHIYSTKGGEDWIPHLFSYFDFSVKSFYVILLFRATLSRVTLKIVVPQHLWQTHRCEWFIAVWDRGLLWGCVILQWHLDKVSHKNTCHLHLSVLNTSRRYESPYFTVSHEYINIRWIHFSGV